jgi:HSP20 family protein
MVSSFWRPFSNVFEPLDFTGWGRRESPLAELARRSEEMERTFRRWGTGQPPVVTFPAMDLWQDEGNLYVEAELPGMEIDDLEIYVTGGNQLTIRGERRPPAAEGRSWHRQERGYGQFSRMLTLPCDVQTEAVEAQLKDGVLTVTLPKSEAARPRRLEIKAE